MKKLVVLLLMGFLAGCTLLKANQEADAQGAQRRAPQAAHLQ